MIMPPGEQESHHETLFWLSQPHIHQSIAVSEADITAGRTFNESQVRQALGLNLTVSEKA